ncbi:MAG: YciI family protein, partial [Longimicrobiales bacterium]
CLIYSVETQWQNMPRDDRKKLIGEYLAFTDDIRKSGHYLGSNPLDPTSTASTVRVKNGEVTVTDGPFAETREQLGGYFLIEARDTVDAIHVASRIPGARFGCIEVRPIVQMDEP